MHPEILELKNDAKKRGGIIGLLNSNFVFEKNKNHGKNFKQ